jgi:hypothetical protein
MKTKFGPSEKDKNIDIDRHKMFQKNSRYNHFDDKRINEIFGTAESRTSGRETSKIQIKRLRHVKRMNNNRVPKMMLNYRSNGRRQFGRSLNSY